MRSLLVAGILVAALAVQAGCRDDSPPPQRVPVPSSRNPDAPLRGEDPVKPLPSGGPDAPRSQRVEPGPVAPPIEPRPTAPPAESAQPALPPTTR